MIKLDEEDILTYFKTKQVIQIAQLLIELLPEEFVSYDERGLKEPYKSEFPYVNTSNEKLDLVINESLNPDFNQRLTAKEAYKLLRCS